MTRFNSDDSSLLDITNDFEITSEFQDFNRLNKKEKSPNNVMRQIEILQENKLLKSCIDDMYDY